MSRFEPSRVRAPGATLAILDYPGSGEPIVMKQLLPSYFVRPECAPKAFDVWRASKRAWRGTNRSVKALSEDHLATISLDAPVLIVQGEQDAIRETNAVLVKRFPAATNVRVANAGHFPWLERPDVFAKTLLDFYSRSVPGGPAQPPPEVVLSSDFRVRSISQPRSETTA